MENDSLYKKIAIDIQKDIKKNHKPGDKLHSEAYYQKKYGVARMTISRALAYLVSANVIYYVKNKGYFVLTKKDYRGNEILSFSQMCQRDGIYVTNRLLGIEIIVPDEEIRKALQLKEGEPVYKISRVRYGNDLPRVIEYAHIVKKYAEGLDKFNMADNSLYEILSDFYGITIDVQDYEYSAINIKGAEAKYLEVSSGSAILKTITTGYMKMGVVPVEYTIQYSKWSTSITLNRVNDIKQ